MNKYVFLAISAIAFVAQAISINIESSENMSFANSTPFSKTQPVYFVTNRNVEEEIFFGSRITNKLNFGKITVQVPPNHIKGNFEVPRGYRNGFIEDPKKHFVASDFDLYDRDTFIHKIHSRSNGRSAFVYLHGFGYSYKRSVFRTAQVAYDMGFKGDVFTFAWPTNNSMSDYFEDKEDALKSVNHFLEFLRILDNAGYDKVHLLSHSMGNFLLAKSMASDSGELFNSMRVPIFDQFVMAAPDISPNEYQDYFQGRLQNLSRRTTVYASSEDLALRISKLLHNGEERFGLIDAESPQTSSEYDLVDATDIESHLVFSSHHTYFGRTRVIEDMKSLFTYNLNPIDRGLLAISTPTKSWLYKIFNHKM